MKAPGEDSEVRRRTKVAPARRRNIRLTRAVTIPPLAEAIVTVITTMTGLHRVEPVKDLMRKQKMTIPHGVIDPVAGSEFPMTIANFSHWERRLPKGTIIGRAVGRPKYLVCPVAEGSETVGRERPNPGVPAWAQDVDLDQLDGRTRSKLLKLLRQYSEICDGRLGTLRGVFHRVDLVSGAKSIFQQPYRAGPEGRKAQAAEVQ